MKQLALFMGLLFIAGGCSSGDTVKSVQSPALTGEDSLIVKKFTGRNTYLIVCRGFPLPDADKDTIIPSARHAARLNAYHFAETTFDETVDVYKDGRVLKFIVKEDHVVIYYEIRKKDLRDRMRKEHIKNKI